MIESRTWVRDRTRLRNRDRFSARARIILAAAGLLGWFLIVEGATGGQAHMVVLAVFGLQPRIVSFDSQAIASLQEIVLAEEKYKAGFGAYATLPQLAKTFPRRIDPALAAGAKGGHLYALALRTPVGTGFQATASARFRKCGGPRSFFVDETGVIRSNFYGPATSADSAIE